MPILRRFFRDLVIAPLALVLAVLCFVWVGLRAIPRAMLRGFALVRRSKIA